MTGTALDWENALFTAMVRTIEARAKAALAEILEKADGANWNEFVAANLDPSIRADIAAGWCFFLPLSVRKVFLQMPNGDNHGLEVVPIWDHAGIEELPSAAARFIATSLHNQCKAAFRDLWELGLDGDDIVDGVRAMVRAATAGDVHET